MNSHQRRIDIRNEAKKLNLRTYQMKMVRRMRKMKNHCKDVDLPPMAIGCGEGRIRRSARMDLYASPVILVPVFDIPNRAAKLTILKRRTSQDASPFIFDPEATSLLGVKPSDVVKSLDHGKD